MQERYKWKCPAGTLKNALIPFLLIRQQPGYVLRLQNRDIDFHRKIVCFSALQTAKLFGF
jgi:hypothetical protein